MGAQCTKHHATEKSRLACDECTRRSTSRTTAEYARQSMMDVTNEQRLNCVPAHNHQATTVHIGFPISMHCVKCDNSCVDCRDAIIRDMEDKLNRSWKEKSVDKVNMSMRNGTQKRKRQQRKRRVENRKIKRRRYLERQRQRRSQTL